MAALALLRAAANPTAAARPTHPSHGRADPQTVTPRSGSPTVRAVPLGPQLHLPFHDPYRQPWSLRGKGHGRFGAATDCGEPLST